MPKIIQAGMEQITTIHGQSIVAIAYAINQVPFGHVLAFILGQFMTHDSTCGTMSKQASAGGVWRIGGEIQDSGPSIVMIRVYPAAISRSGYFITASESICLVPILHFTGHIPYDTLHSFFNILGQKTGSSTTGKVALYFELLLQSKFSDRIGITIKIIGD